MVQTRVGFIGAGGIASRHIGDLLGFKDVKVVAVADPLLERAEQQAGRCKARAYNDYSHMMESEKLDAIYICVPPFTHGEPEQACIELGLPFFVEKPLSVDWDTASSIADQIEERSLVTAIGYHWRYLNTVERAQELLQENPARMVLGYWLDSTPPPSWWRKDAESGGQMVEQTTHIFDVARLLVGDVTRIYATGSRKEREAFPDSDVLDVSVATLDFAGGAVGTMASTCLLNWPHRVGLHLFCEGMAIELTEFDMMVDVGRGRPVERAEGDPFVREDRDFIDAVQGKENKIRAPYAEALKTHRLTTSAARSAREGRPLELQPQMAEA